MYVWLFFSWYFTIKIFFYYHGEGAILVIVCDKFEQCNYYYNQSEDQRSGCEKEVNNLDGVRVYGNGYCKNRRGYGSYEVW